MGNINEYEIGCGFGMASVAADVRKRATEDEEFVNESMSDVLKATTLAVLLAVPDLVDAKDIADKVGAGGKNTVVQTLDSPSGAYYAEHSNTDLGVSGGKTYGHICQDKLDLGFLKLTRREMVYYNRFGGQSEPDVLQMYWEDDSRLIINGWAYDNPLDD